jgi:hypothetical protein
MKKLNTFTKLITTTIFGFALFALSAQAATLSVQLAPISDSGMSSSDGITFVKKPNFIGTGPAGNMVNVSDGSRILCTIPVNNDGTWMCTSIPTLADGTYSITVSPMGSPDISPATSITIDTNNITPPSVPLIDPTQVFGINPFPMVNSKTLRFTGTAEPGAKVRIINNNDNSSFCFVDAAPITGIYDCTATVSTETDYTEFSFSARSTDTEGNMSDESLPVTIVVSLTAPTLPSPSTPVLATASDTGVSTSDRYTNDTTPTFTGTGIAGTPLYLTAGANAGGTTVCNTVVAPDGTWSCTTSALAGHPLAVHYFVRAHYSPTQSSAALEVDIDNENRQSTTKPDIKTEFDNGVSDSDNITSLNPFRVWGYAENLVKIDVFVNNIFNCAVTSTGGGYWSCLLSVAGPGTYAIDTVETDRAGNLSARSEILNATITP